MVCLKGAHFPKDTILVYVRWGIVKFTIPIKAIAYRLEIRRGQKLE